MNKPDDYGWLDKALSGDTGHIDDNGFTDIVMKRLPSRKPRRRWMHAGILSAAALLSGVILLWSLPDPTVLYARLGEFVYSQSIISLGLLSVALCAVAGLLTAWLLNLDK